jgi:hypothetical protein
MNADVYVPKTRRDALHYIAFCWETYDKEVCPQLSDWPHLLPRQRRVSVIRLIKQARKAASAAKSASKSSTTTARGLSSHHRAKARRPR